MLALGAPWRQHNSPESSSSPGGVPVGRLIARSGAESVAASRDAARASTSAASKICRERKTDGANRRDEQRDIMLLHTALVFALAASAHICLFAPRQRGNLSSPLMPGDETCYRRTPYCGGVAPGAPSASYVAGSEIDVHFQQNLNHWVGDNPGFFDVAVAYVRDPKEADFEVLSSFKDYAAHDMVSPTNFSLTVKLPPSRATAHGVLRLRYVSHNKDEVDPKNNTEAIFYNCADIEVLAAAQEESEPRTAGTADATKAKTTESCSLPDQFTLRAHETNALGVVVHSVYWDGKAQKTRWDRSGRFFGDPSERTLSCISDYAKHIEYLFYPEKDQCLLYGPDQYYAWAYGPQSGHTYHNRTQIGSTVIDAWWGGGNGGRFVTTPMRGDGECRPVSWSIGGNTFSVVDFEPGAPNPELFTPDKSCDKPVFGGCHKERVREAFLAL